MSNSAAEEPPRHKKTKEEPLPPASSSPFTSLPDAVALSCVVRVSKLERAALSVVSNSVRSLLVSPDFNKTRSLFGLAEKLVYVCLRTPPPGPGSPRWFICRIEEDNHCNRLCQISSSRSNQALKSSVVSLDWGIYVIGGKLNGERSSDVSLLDCRSHRWQKVSSMRVARASAVAGVVDGKIYVFGGCEERDLWGEVFDPKTQTWEALPDCGVRTYGLIRGGVVVEKKVYAVDAREQRFYYSPSEGKWEVCNYDFTRCCVIDGLLCFCDSFGNLFWCEPKDMALKKVHGLEDLERRVSGSKVFHFDGYVSELSTLTSTRSENGITRMCSYGGNLLVFWDVAVVCDGDDDDEVVEIWCAEISLERRPGDEVWGKIEWSRAVMSTDPLLYCSEVLHSVSVTV
ncbi:unnamed protein product [Microthlaspi erraticum]|uniref:FKB95-like N-terminal Kelch domain-containing protein n=1 Tax=Microthlaspi erraticum TaxID=1685480 RepID=A0A6D2I172_9BRAS|nr:unnamed protein product [Microthlaspi erraticum]